MNNKRGLSAVVTTLLIILLALVAIGAIWVVVGSLISEGAGDINLEQFTLDLSIKNAYIDTADLDNIKVRVKRSVGAGEITGIRFIFFNGIDSTTITKETSLTEFDEETFSFTPTELGDIEEGDSVSIAPVFETDSGKEKTGAVTDTEQIRGEAPGGSGVPECNDGFDNDDDGDTDYPDDAGCDDLNDGDETNCGDLKCEGGESFETCSLDCSPPRPATCDEGWNPPEDPEVECDGLSPIQGCDLSICVCLVGFTSDGVGGCDLNPPVNSGTVLSIWPDPLAVVFFDSPGLPTTPSEFPAYGGRSINFSGGVCTIIGYLQFVVETGRSYAQLV
ncbi:MAG: hypothetical protein IIB81_03925, partial [Nanoarchaeota archaeon]|nr:hypothetical protein [Nanoarchaeota archaeon]